MLPLISSTISFLKRPLGVAALAGLIVTGAALPLAFAQQEAAYNPHPAPGDVLLPLPGGWKIAFTKVPVPGRGFYGGSDRIMEIGGDKQSPNPHEHPRQVRIGANFFDKSGAGYILVGKYEVTIGQYAALIGDGDIGKGLKLLAESSSIDILTKDAGAAATLASDMRFLARPIHGLAIDDYWAFLSQLNAWCLTTKEGAACLAAMRKELGSACFFRLPSEPEWEFVARGGIKGMRAAQTLPFPVDDIAARANVGTKKSQPDEIGKRKPHSDLPVYDMFGNVAELMGTPFTLDNGAGAIGSFVLRGGDFRTAASDLRVSYREEEPQFVFRSSAGMFVKRKRPEVGIRLMIGAPVKDPEDRTVTTRIADEFRGSYVPCCGGGGGGGAVADAYGNTLRLARDIGALAIKKNIELSDSVGGPDDPADWFRFAVTQFGTLRMGLQAQDADAIMEVKHESWESPRIFSVKAGRIDAQVLQGLLPGNVRVKVFAADPSKVARWRVIMNFDAYDCCGNRAEEARDLGLLAGRQIDYSDYVGPGDLVDFVKFRTDRVDTISVRLLELTGDANIELFDSEKRLIDKSLNPGNAPERIEFANAPPGTYYIRVFAKDERAASMYKMVIALGNVDTAGDTAKSARDLGTISSDVVTVDESVGAEDRGDVFKFRTTATAVIEIQISKLSSDVTLELLDASERPITRGSRD
ncbi:MAG TPA: SUMF1/EgtB/PvdO family nonheme iron enzyme, partial [Hyphomicrobiaceae bacterium]|nr:SUMF1/EgtB/PvdO family nonheme iron enzyme [Hyphomicrobiaceae bacterium]